MRWVRRALLVVGVLVMMVAVGGYWYIRPLVLTGSGYAAHNACAVQFVAGRTNPDADLPDNPLLPYLRTASDDELRHARSSLLGLLAPQQAWYTPGYGCTLGDERPAYPPAPPVNPAANPFSLARQPVAPLASPGVATAVAAAFGDHLGEAERAELGTRAVLVVHRGRVIAERYAPGFGPTTPQLGWSLAKSVTSLLTGRVVQQGKLAISDARLRPEWTDQRAAITVDHLMRMTSGLAWDETYDLGTPITDMLYREADMAGYAASQPAQHAPGTVQQYSTGSTNILCSVLRQRTGAGPELPRTLLLGPLGLSGAAWEADGVGTPVCGSYLWASAREWAAIGQFALQDGVWAGRRLLPEGWMRATTTVAPGAGQERGYAAGWWVNRLPGGELVERRLPADAYWGQGHDGQRLYVVPSAQLIVVRLGFTPSLSSAQLNTHALVADLLADRAVGVRG